MPRSRKRPHFSNFSNKISLSIDAMYRHLTDLTGGWPRLISGELCYQAAEELHALQSSPALFAWIDNHAMIHWGRGGVTKEEFFEGLRQKAERFAWSSSYPHFPRLPGVFYTCRFPEAKSSGALDNLIDCFKPATRLDRQLLKGAVMTAYWGGPAGKRPTFVLTSEPNADQGRGCGVGKTTFIEMLAKLVGGYISVRLHTSADRVIAGLLSPSCWQKRIALIDNLKTYRFSNDMIESLVTCEEINGHRLHHGFASRPNLLTWMITVNGASFSKDMAQRSVVIYLRRPETSGSWYDETTKFIDRYRRQIVADIRWHLEQPAQRIEKLDRWPDWGEGVLSHLEDPEEVLRQLKQRREAIDEDNQDAADLVDYLRACLQDVLGRTPDEAVVGIPSLLLGKWVRRLKTTMTDRQVAQYLRQVNISQLQYKRDKNKRYYLWVGANADANRRPYMLEFTVDIEPKWR